MVSMRLSSPQKRYIFFHGQTARLVSMTTTRCCSCSANMDIQFIDEESHGLAHYVTGYITKANRSNMQAIWNKVASQKSIYSRLFSFGIRSMRSWECGLYEDSNLLLGEQLCGKSDSINWIDAAFPHKRKRRIKDHKKLEELHSKEPNSSDIFEYSLIDTITLCAQRSWKKCASVTL